MSNPYSPAQRLLSAAFLRIASAAALILADEATGNLDSKTGERVRESLLDEQTARGVSLLLVTHDERLAARCERVLYMKDGMIEMDSSEPLPT